MAEIYNTFNNFQDSIFWLGGDFNLPDINWQNQDIPGNQYLKSINEIFLEMSQDLGLQQIVDFPTRGTSLLDVFFTNKPDLVNNCKLLAGLGDHGAVNIVYIYNITQRTCRQTHEDYLKTLFQNDKSNKNCGRTSIVENNKM